MPIDKFGRNGDRATPVYTKINIANLTNTFLRRYGGNTAIEAMDMNSVVKSRCCNQELYIHIHAFSTCWWCCIRRCSIKDWF